NALWKISTIFSTTSRSTQGLRLGPTSVRHIGRTLNSLTDGSIKRTKLSRIVGISSTSFGHSSVTTQKGMHCEFVTLDAVMACSLNKCWDGTRAHDSPCWMRLLRCWRPRDVG